VAGVTATAVVKVEAVTTSGVVKVQAATAVEEEEATVEGVKDSEAADSVVVKGLEEVHSGACSGRGSPRER